MTFLLTDIEGSTQAWQASPKSMTALVSRHYEILESGIAAHHGQRPEEQGEGDSVVAVFTDVHDAVAAALETQLALRRELPNLPVRMALHRGEAMLRNENNYVGLTIIRCARIRACGFGGQILLSEAVTTAVQEGLPEAVEVLDLGAYGLRGLDGRQRIWQLIHPDLPSDFPPLKAGTSAAGNLPNAISSFVGRRSELTAISHSVAAHRLVTITSPPGYGKSRLANAAADATANSMPGGVWWAALGDETDDDTDDVAASLLRACSLTRVAGEDPVETLIAHFNSVADALLVIDAAEQAPAAAAQIIDRVLTRCPNVRALATGRRPLGIPGEIVHALAPLTVPPVGFEGDLADLAGFDAARLFIERAGNVDRDQTLTDRDVADIARICRELDGVPLGLELAAARSGSISLTELADSLGQLAATPKHSTSAGMIDTLASSIAWSYQFLTEHQQRALRYLSVFRGSFEIDAATAIVTGGDLDERAAATALNALIDQHLLVAADDGRLTLPPAIRGFAHERLLGSHDAASAVARHGAWFADLAERFGAAGLAVSESLLIPDLADLLGALDASMVSDDPTTAYRILTGLGARLHLLDRPEAVDAAVRWIAGRSPSDGEERWAAAVARLSYAQSTVHGSPLAGYDDEAQAIAELVGDQMSPLYIEYGRAARAALAGELEPAQALAAAARRASVAEVVVAIEQQLAAAYSRAEDREHFEAIDAALTSMLGGGSYQGPVPVDVGVARGRRQTDLSPATWRKGHDPAMMTT